MVRWQRRGASYVGLFVAVLGVYVVAYHLGMVFLEGESVTALHSLQVVVETFTTVGYGSDAPWSSPLMNLLVVAMNLTGVVLVFMALPLLVVPLLENAISTSPPRDLDAVTDHVLVCGHTARGEPLADQLAAWDTPFAFVVADREAAAELHGRDVPVIHGDPQTADALERARAPEARALVADADDETNASIVLAAKEVAPGTRVVATVEDPDDARYLSYAGADEVLMPRHLLGESLAEHVTPTVTTSVGEGASLGDNLEIAEVPVAADSDVAGRTLARSEIRERTGVDVIGAWHRGSFVAPLSPDDVIPPRSVLVVSGTTAQVEGFRNLVAAGPRAGDVVVVGYGEVGRTVTAELAAADVPYRVVDRVEHGGVDVVGEATDESTLTEAGVESARAVVLAIPDDTTTAYATLVVRELEPDVEVVARADETAAERKLYLAGADYVQSVATVSGRMLAAAVLDEEEVIGPEQQVEVVKVEAPGLAGLTLGEARVRERTGCTVVAIERDGDLLAEFGPATTIRETDRLVLAGTGESVTSFGNLSR